MLRNTFKDAFAICQGTQCVFFHGRIFCQLQQSRDTIFSGSLCIGVKTGYTGIRNELTDVRRELRHDIREKLDLILKFVLEDRQDIRDVEDTIRQLETKLA